MTNVLLQPTLQQNTGHTSFEWYNGNILKYIFKTLSIKQILKTLNIKPVRFSIYLMHSNEQKDEHKWF